MAEEGNKLKTGQKLAAGVLAVFGIFVIIMWAYSFRSTVYGPFKYQGITQAGICPSGNCEQDRDMELLSKDTDMDGLSDWEELNIYRTSPYIEDSDSDGYTDREEVETGFDPNCPRGSNCNTSNILIRDVEEPAADDFLGQSDLDLLNSLLESGGLEGDLGISSEQAGQREGLEETLAGKSSAEQLRSLLLEAGMDKKILDQISDEVLMESYRDILIEN